MMCATAKIAAFWLWLGLATAALAVDGEFSVRAQADFRAARARWQSEPRDVQAAWQFGRAAFDLAEFATNKTERASLAAQGIAACRQGLARSSNSAPAHYYLGMNLGQLARTRSLGAFKLVDEMEIEFDAARKLDEHFDYAGPDRNLGLLYRDAPAIVSIGSRTRARQHLERAVVLAPDYPENRLALIEGLIKWNSRSSARHEFKELEASWPGALDKFSGAAWAVSRADWQARFQKVKTQVEEPSKLELPRH